MQSNPVTYPPPAPSTHHNTSNTPLPTYNASNGYADPYSTYAPPHGNIPPSPYDVKRSGSPTPSEAQELKQLDGTLTRMFRKESWKDRQFVISVIVLGVILVAVILIAVYKDKIVLDLAPAARWVEQQTVGFLIPIAFLIILSIPPLVGAEVIHLLCGFAYGFGVGFAIVCAGTIIGESITYFAFRYCFRSRAEKLETGGHGSLRWPSLARVLRNGGFWTAVVVRYTFIPTHITTALFSVCGLTYWQFLGSLVLALPRQIIGVYVGVLAADQANGKESTLDKKVTYAVLGVTIAVTVFAMRWIDRRQKAAALAIIRERRAESNAYSGVPSAGSLQPRAQV